MWLSWLEHCLTEQKVTGLIPSQATYLGRRFDPRLGCVQEGNHSMFLPLSLSHCLSLKRNEKMSSSDDKKIIIKALTMCLIVLYLIYVIPVNLSNPGVQVLLLSLFYRWRDGDTGKWSKLQKKNNKPYNNTSIVKPSSCQIYLITFK